MTVAALRHYRSRSISLRTSNCSLQSWCNLVFTRGVHSVVRGPPVIRGPSSSSSSSPAPTASVFFLNQLRPQQLYYHRPFGARVAFPGSIQCCDSLLAASLALLYCRALSAAAVCAWEGDCSVSAWVGEVVRECVSGWVLENSINISQFHAIAPSDSEFKRRCFQGTNAPGLPRHFAPSDLRFVRDLDESGLCGWPVELEVFASVFVANELAKVVSCARRSDPSQAVADDNFNMNGWAMSGSSSGVIAQSSIAKLHSSAKETFSLWVASTFGSATKDDAAAQALPSVTPPPKPLVSLSWEATVPIAAYSLDPPLPNVPAAFPITELRAVPNTGLDHFVMATSSNGKPLYGAYVVNSQGELCLQQLFEFSPTAFDAGVFLPVPTVGGHFQGAYGLDYARHRFNGSIASLPRLMCWPASPTSSRPSVSLNLMGPSVGHDLVPVAASNSVPPTYHDSFMSPQLPTLPHREMLDQANAVSSQLVASSYTDRASSFKDAPEKQLQRVPSSCASKEAVSPPLRNPDEHPQRRVSPNCSDEGVSPLRTPDEHPQQRIPPSCSKEQGVSPLRIPDAHPQQRVPLASCSDEDVSPLRTPNEHPQKRVGTSSGSKEAVPSLRIPDEHPQRRARTPSCSNKADEDPQQRGLEPVKAAPSASQVKASFDGKELASKGAGASRKSWVEASEKPAQCVATRIPDRCHPCFLCDSCKKHWGISGLPEKHFENPRKEVFRIPEEDVPAILCSEKTAARKRKWAQCRHGPKSKTSEYRGVNLYKRTWKWEAHIWYDCSCFVSWKNVSQFARLCSFCFLSNSIIHHANYCVCPVPVRHQCEQLYLGENIFKILTWWFPKKSDVHYWLAVHLFRSIVFRWFLLNIMWCFPEKSHVIYWLCDAPLHVTILAFVDTCWIACIRQMMLAREE